jgi:hypothetical protein
VFVDFNKVVGDNQFLFICLCQLGILIIIMHFTEQSNGILFAFELIKLNKYNLSTIKMSKFITFRYLNVVMSNDILYWTTR